MQRRIFIAINLDDNIKRYIERKLNGLKERLHIKWIPKDNFHITISYIGFIDDQLLYEIICSLKEELKRFESFDLKFNHLEWGPRPNKRKMIWIQGPANNDLFRLRNIIVSSINKIYCKKSEYRPHITCARLKQRESATISKDGIILDKKINFVVPVRSVDIMESVFSEGFRVFRNLEIIELN